MTVPSSIATYEAEQAILRNRRWGMLAGGVMVGGIALLAILRDVDERLDGAARFRSNIRFDVSEIVERLESVEQRMALVVVPVQEQRTPQEDD